jgi:sugar lactone lactonase YvrE
VSDFYTHRVSRITPDGTVETVVEVESQPSGLGWLPDGSLVISSMLDHRVLLFANGELSTLADLSDYCTGPLNDLVVDAAGNIFVGDFGYDLNGGEPARTTTLKRVDREGEVTVVADDLQFPNGSVITSDGTTLIVGETFGNRYTAWDLSADGALSNRRVWACFGPDLDFSDPGWPKQMALAPDGCAIDADGHLWVTDAMGGRAVRVAPGGAIVDEIPAPEGLGLFACALGGPAGHTLLLCAVPPVAGLDSNGPHDAVLLTADVTVPAPGAGRRQ